MNDKIKSWIISIIITLIVGCIAAWSGISKANRLNEIEVEIKNEK